MVKWYTRHADNTGATATYVGLTLDTRNSTAASPKVPPGYGHVKYISATFGIDAAIVADVGNIFVLKLSGDAMYHGDQEIIFGALSTSETASSVTDMLMQKATFVLDTNIWLKPGQPVDLSTAYVGSDTGSQIASVSLGLEVGRGGSPRQYRTRVDSHTAATDAYEALDTKVDTTAGTGAFEAPAGVFAINRALFAAVLNADADTIISINPWVLEFSGDAIGTAQEIVVQSLGADEGGGTVTSTHNILFNPAVIPVEIPLVGGSSFAVGAAYKGVDLGTPFVATTLELLGGKAVQ